MSRPRVSVIGAGVAGLVAALELSARGARVEVFERAHRLGADACSWMAGGMLAPWCEGHRADACITALGREALDWWPRHLPATTGNGTLVLSMPRDRAELDQFAGDTSQHRWLHGEAVGKLEPDLAGRFERALFFPGEAHLDPRRALTVLAGQLAARGVRLHLGTDGTPAAMHGDHVLDCRGFAARDALDGLRGVRGEMLLLHSAELRFSRPLRLLHPRWPLYVVPRGEGLFMIGASMLESADRGAVSARSAVELLNAAYALHPAFAAARIVELGADARPAFSDNLPRVIRRGRITYLNGLYRHGFLLAPALARQAAEAICQQPWELSA